ncbi:hypothetical protein [Nostoc sp. FACHB-888]|uniref:hypothetical protein n=1 Tax=Nostoc sp. FACHB-888 TaxID=2692842 RepID=UPI001688F352|nr:hypothetical protein [Nostoc sp. FACHB-888]MBD2249588.1 hypothetical protein [Nostoc sp. FACHB-888]
MSDVLDAQMGDRQACRQVRSLHHQFSRNSTSSKTSLWTWFWLNSFLLPFESLKTKGALTPQLDRWL